MKPKAGWLKMNTDASINLENGRMGFSWVLQYENGSFKATMSIPGKGVYSPKEAGHSHS